MCGNVFIGLGEADLWGSDNDFWCPSPAWCDDEDESSLECGCVAEPSDECTLINKMACNSELVCCKY